VTENEKGYFIKKIDMPNFLRSTRHSHIKFIFLFDIFAWKCERFMSELKIEWQQGSKWTEH